MIQWNLWISPTPGSDENGAHDQGAQNSPEQDLVLVDGRHLKETENEQEDEEVVDAEREFDDVSGHELQHRRATVPEKDRDGEDAASAIQATLQNMASRNLTVWERRWNTPRSSTSMARTKRLNKIQNSSNDRPRFPSVVGH